MMKFLDEWKLLTMEDFLGELLKVSSQGEEYLHHMVLDLTLEVQYHLNLEEDSLLNLDQFQVLQKLK
jgi:hypothetical protein